MQTKLTTFITALSVIGWGIQLANPFTDVFILFENQLGFLSQIWNSELGWGLFAITAGIITIYGYRKTNRRICYTGLQLTLVFRLLILITVVTKTAFAGTGLFDFIAWVVICLIAMQGVRQWT